MTRKKNNALKEVLCHPFCKINGICFDSKFLHAKLKQVFATLECLKG